MGRFYFEGLYAEDDPWHYEDSEYEKAKYAKTLAALPREKYCRGLEIGCSIGIFTRLLAERVERLDALDISRRAVARAAERRGIRDLWLKNFRSTPCSYQKELFLKNDGMTAK